MPLPLPQFADGSERLRILESFDLESLEDDPELMRIVSFAAKLCCVPVSAVSLIEDARQRFLVGEGIVERETPRKLAFCELAKSHGEIMEIRDAQSDERFANNPLVTGPAGIRFYAGYPLVSEEGAPLGALCAIDVVARPDGLSELQREGLGVLAQAVMRRLHERRAHARARVEIESREQQLRRMIEGVPQIAWSADEAGNFDYYNSRWVQITGDAPPRLSDDWLAYIHPEDAKAVLDGWYESFAKSVQYNCEYRLKTREGWRWVLSLAVPVAEKDGGAVRWFGTITDIHEVRRSLEERDMLAKELSHRIKNIFAVVIGLTSLKVRKTPEHKPFADELIAVLHALGRAHDVVHAGPNAEQDSLLGLLGAVFAPYASETGDARVRITGDDSPIHARAATPLALVFHELATNSAKYGALSDGAGHVELTLVDSGADIAMIWREFGGPAIAPGAGLPDGGGFGTRLVEMSITGQLQGSWERDFAPDGLVARLTVAKAALAG